jgi:hypothetical protein
VKAITFETLPKAADRIMGDPWRGLLANGKIAGHYSPAFLRSIEKALAPLPDQRWQDARQWQEAAFSAQAPARETPRAEVATARIRADRGDAIEPRAEAADPFVAYAKPARKASKDTRNNLIGGACGLAVLGVVILILKNSGAERITEEEKTQKEEIVEISAAQADPASIPADRLPTKVLLKVEVEIVDVASDLRMKVPAGNRMNLIRLEGAYVIISPGAGSFEGKVPIEQTDLMEQLAAMPDTSRPVEPKPRPEEPVATPPAEPAPQLQPRLVPTPKPTPKPVPEPVPAPSSGDIVSIMKASIRAGEIKEFTFEQVLEWQGGEGMETINGQSYQTGIVSYKAESVFGVKTIQAKALIQGGKVIRWFWPKSGMQMK